MGFEQERKIMFVVASRPNFMKVAPLVKEAKKQNLNFSILYTEQHKSELMSEVFFKELDIPKPDFSLGLKEKVKKASKFRKGLALITSIPEARRIIKRANPRIVVVVGDVVSSAYIAVICKWLQIPVAHVEAGLRSFNRKMPEERARKIIDRCSKIFFTTEESATKNLFNEGKNAGVFFVGNVMIDTLKSEINKIEKIGFHKKLKLKKGYYGIATFHRHENITSKRKLEEFLEILRLVTQKTKILYPIHPSTKKQLEKFGIFNTLKRINNLEVIEPLGYLQMLSLVKNSKFVITDSGGLQEETTFLGIPCLTLRDETERPCTVEEGTNTIVGLDKKKIMYTLEEIYLGKYKKGKIPKNWDGNTAKRIIQILKHNGLR